MKKTFQHLEDGRVEETYRYAVGGLDFEATLNEYEGWDYE